MEKSVIPIVFAANDNYTLFCYIAIYSVIRNAGKDYFYHIYVFQTNMSKKNCKLLESLSNDNIEVECINISNYILNIKLKESLHFSIETYYRLFIPSILPQYKKVLYLDSDMCILQDVAELFQCDLNGYAVAAAPDIPCYSLKRHFVELGELDCKKTFNAGVLVIDNVKFEKKKIRQMCLKLLKEDYKRKERKLIFPDQDALNIVLNNDYFILDRRWNYQPQYLWRTEEVFEESRQQYIEDKDKAFIMHFAGDKKPWKYPDLPKSDIFWDYAKQIDIFEKVMTHIMADAREAEDTLKCFDEYQFPYAQIPFQSKIILYAAGNVGKAFFRQLRLSKYADVVLWVDKNWRNMEPKFQIEAVEKIADTDYDYLIIAIDSKLAADTIKSNMIQMNVPENKIVWEEYRREHNS